MTSQRYSPEFKEEEVRIRPMVVAANVSRFRSEMLV